MKVHRFVSIGELRELHVSGKVEPLNPSDRLYFFADDDWHDPQMQLGYLQGIVAESEYREAKDRGKAVTHTFHILLHLDIEASELKEESRPYSDPYGAWYDRIWVEELHLYGAYYRGNVETVEFVVNDRWDLWKFPKQERHFDSVEKALQIIDKYDIKPYKTMWERLKGS